ncbi:MAG: hypothetical protein MUF05_01450 [Candidatus Omnitrophica bacterium]|jgi:uncharacterized paraquat-inducible protein A|nr:hypothetical protein [Candidatus Omnitrophota bacterium]
MFTLDFSLALGLYCLLFTVVSLVFWLWNKAPKKRVLSLEEKYIWFCSVCTYTYVNTKEEFISICPRCGNYNKK